MKFRIASDIHNEFLSSSPDYQDYEFPPLPDDKDTTLILAGDIGVLCSPRTYAGFYGKCSKQFKNIFVVEGNHCFYNGNIDTLSIQSMIDAYQMPNVFTDKLIFDDEKIAIIGKTLWTDFNNGDPLSMFYAQKGMNDFRCITIDDGKTSFLPPDALKLHYEQKKYIFDNVKYYTELGYKVIVVTHHQPSSKAIDKLYQGSPLNGAFYSELDEEIKQHKIEYWIAGHTHTSIKYEIGDTKCITNVLGYPFEKGATGFDPLLTIEVTNE